MINRFEEICSRIRNGFFSQVCYERRTRDGIFPDGRCAGHWIGSWRCTKWCCYSHVIINFWAAVFIFQQFSRQHVPVFLIPLRNEVKKKFTILRVLRFPPEYLYFSYLFALFLVFLSHPLHDLDQYINVTFNPSSTLCSI